MPSLADLAIIIPAGPQDTSWQALLPQLRGLPAQAEVVLSLVAGDPPCASAEDARVKVLHGVAGRSAQQNAGAAATQRPWLWFLHADSRIDNRALQAIENFGEDEALAYFDLSFYDGPRLMVINHVGAWLRSRVLGLPFGDQGLLLPRRWFESLGGFDERVSHGEDHALVWAARRAGLPISPLRASLSTSARRYREHGWWRTTGRHVQLTWQQARQFSARPTSPTS